MASNNPLVAMTLYGSGRRVKLWIEGGVQRLRELSTTPSSLFWAGGGPGRYGDGEPDYAFNEQRDWSGGRGLENFADDQSRYLDSYRAWTLTPGRIGPAPQWFFARTYRPNLAEFSLPGNVTWQPLYDSQKYLSRSFTPSATITADKAYLWIRRVGTPGTLTLEVCSDSSGSPGSVLKTATITTSTITDVESVFQAFDWTSTQSLTGSTTYHLKLYGASTDSGSDHWEVATDITGSSSKYSSDNSTWNSAGFSLYYRIVGADIKATHKFFVLDSVLYAVSCYKDGTASRLWMNGARGKATAGAATTLTDSNASFGTSSQFDGALVKIIRGTGLGQVRTISSHTGTVLTVSAAWDINPSTDSEYFIYQTPRFTEITSTGLGVVETIAVYNNIAHFGHVKSGDPIRKIRFNPGASPPAHEFADDSTNEANKLCVSYLAATPGGILWRAVNEQAAATTTTVSNGPFVAWGSSHTFGTAVTAGNANFLITDLVDQTDTTNSRLFVMKTGEIGFIDTAKFYRLNVNIDAITMPTNGVGAIVHGLYLYFPWGNSLERLYGSALDDIDPNAEGGFPLNRQGIISKLAAHPIGVLCAIDAGDSGYSSVLFYDVQRGGYHEIFRAWEAGKRINDVRLVANDGGKLWLWVSVGDDIVYMQFPVRNPFRDSSQTFMHEWSVTTATFDMGNSAIYKAWKSLTLVTKNLDGAGIYAEIDYQKDGDIDGSTWTTIGRIQDSPSDFVNLFIGESKQIRFRIRAYSNSATTPALVSGIVLKGVGQLPTKYNDTFWVQFGNVAEQIGASGPEEAQLIIDGTSKATIWEVVECAEYQRAVGKRFLANIIEIDPLYSINSKDNFRALLHLSGLDGG